MASSDKTKLWLLQLYSFLLSGGKMSNKTKIAHRDSRSWNYRSKKQYNLKETWCYSVCRNHWVSGKEVNALFFPWSSGAQFTEQIVITLYWNVTAFFGSRFVKFFRNEKLKDSWRFDFWNYRDHFFGESLKGNIFEKGSQRTTVKINTNHPGGELLRR